MSKNKKGGELINFKNFLNFLEKSLDQKNKK